MRSHYTLTRIAQVKKAEHNKLSWACEAIETLRKWWQECKMVQSFWGKVWQVLKKLNMYLPHNPAIQLPGIYLKEMKTCPCRDKNFHSSFIHNSPKLDRPKFSSGGKWNKQIVVYPFKGNHYLTIKGNKMLIHATALMNFQSVILSERSLS